MQFTIKQIAELINGEILGDGNQLINQFYKIEEGQPNGISFLSNPKYENYLYDTNSSAVIVNKDFEPREALKTTLIRVDDAYVAFSQLLQLYQKASQSKPASISAQATIDPTAIIGQEVSIGAFSSVGANAELADGTSVATGVSIGEGVKIGKNTRIHANVTVYPNCVIGDNCVIKAGAVIGSEGFGFAPQKDGTYVPIPQIGNVVIENNVSIGANTCIDCGTMGSTLIGEGTKIDNLVQIAHNVVIGKHTVIAALTGIAGSAKIGNHCVLAGQIGVVGHLEIADYTKIAAKSGINHNIKQEGTELGGSPAFPLKDYLKSAVLYKQLPSLDKRITELEKLLKSYLITNEQR